MDEEEARAARLFAAGKISEQIWDSLWREWQDRRNKIRGILDSVQQHQETHIKNLDAALSIIAQVGIVYNSLERSDQKELLRQMVERVVVNPAGNAKVELRAPFAYLSNISNQIRGSGAVSGCEDGSKTQTGSRLAAGSGNTQCSDWVLFCGKSRSQSEHFSSNSPLDCIQQIEFPQRTGVVRFIDPNRLLAVR